MSSNPPRILSLLSASTEIVYRLGMGHALVGRSHGCDSPVLATTLTPCTAPYVDPNAKSEELDAAVRAVAAEGGPVYHIYSDQLAKLRPTVIIAQNQCRICAVTGDDVNNACQMLPECTVVTIQPTTLDDVLNDVHTIAKAIGVPSRGERLIRHIRRGLDDVRVMASEAAGVDGGVVTSRPRVAHLEWLAPLMGSGYWIQECVAAAGGDMVHGSRGGNSGTLSGINELADADVIIIAPCGFSIERTNVELSQIGLLTEQSWLDLPAVASGRVHIADGNLYYNRSSCGVLETAEMTAEMIWPELTGLWGHHGERFVRLNELDAFCARPDAAPVTKPVQVEQPPSRTEDKNDMEHPVRPASSPTTVAMSSPQEVVASQLDALLAGNFEEAYALNSPANQARLGSARNFAQMVKMSGSFSVLTVPGRTVQLTTPSCNSSKEEKNGKNATEATTTSSIGVRAASPGGQIFSFIFDLIQSDDGVSWRTDGVRIEC